jgi:glycosyltransferase involved in cell wall biosynthesis
VKMNTRTRALAGRRIGFVSTRFEGTDGVSLETEKWVQVLEHLRCKCFFFAGASEWGEKRSTIVEEAHFQHPEIRKICQVVFSQRIRPDETTQRISQLKDHLKKQLQSFVHRFGIELLLVENALSIPMNIPLGLALTELIAESGLPTIAHNHDFFWERDRFLVNCVGDYISIAFPPQLPTIHHVVLNSLAARQLSLRRGVSSLVIPNVMDFDHPPAPPDGYIGDVRQDFQIGAGEWFLLQPTRVVPRKGIEHAIELTRRLGERARLVISHASGDEGYAYQNYLREYAQLMGASVKFEAERIQDKRGNVDDHKIYTLADVYPRADLVTYPSTVEGFGNAFLEAVYYRRPLVVNNYSIFDIDIKPKGFNVIEFEGFITDETVEHARQVLEDPELGQQMAEHNYQVALRHYSFTVLERRLETLLAECFGED